MKYQIAPTWFASVLENASVFRTRRLHRWRKVVLKRSSTLVLPLPLSLGWCRFDGNTVA
jgi:hypothetical protein